MFINYCLDRCEESSRMVSLSFFSQNESDDRLFDFSMTF